MYEYLINTCFELYKKAKSVKENIRGIFVSARVAAEECYSDEDSKDTTDNNDLSWTLEGDSSLSFKPIFKEDTDVLNSDREEFPEPEGPPPELEPIFQEDTMNCAPWDCHEPEGSPPIIVGSSWFRQFEEEGNDIAPTNMHVAPFSGFEKVGTEPLGSLYSIDENSDYS